MASNSSGSLAPGASYSLGEYMFTLSNVVTEDERVLQAHCSGPEGNAAGGITVSTSTQLLSWSVEADETEASVYATVKVTDSPLDTGPISVPFPYGFVSTQVASYNTWTYSGCPHTLAYSTPRSVIHIGGSSSPGSVLHGTATDGRVYDLYLNSSFTHNGKTVYYVLYTGGTWAEHPVISPDCGGGQNVSISQQNAASIAWIMVYGDNPTSEVTDKLVARFPIDIQDAGDGWGDSGDPMTTLHVVVTGALSGRHNDPTASAEGAEIYSYVPIDNAKEAWYGCGGDGGYGGGGGAGASTIIINEFPTSRAGNKELVANARRHGYGSGGGKGGNGGDGCILIYYSTPVPPNP